MNQNSLSTTQNDAQRNQLKEIVLLAVNYFFYLTSMIRKFSFCLINDIGVLKK